MPPERRISVADPISRAIDRTMAILFKPFSPGKWFILGFCAFLAHLAEGGGGSGAWRGWTGGGGGGGGPVGPNGAAWIKANLGLIASVAFIVVIVFILLAAVLTWLRSRGAFMFLDGVVTNRAAVREPWVRFRELGNSLFIFSLALTLAGFFGVMMILTLAGVVAWPDLRSGTMGVPSWTAIMGGSLSLMVFGATLSLIGAILRDFVVPIMYARNALVLPAWSIFRRTILAGHVGTIALFYLMRILLAIAMSVLAVAATCLTCCLAAVPYLGTVILLPLYVFTRCYSLCFLEQFGEGWRFFGVRERCWRCGYSLAGALGPGRCPECGTPFEITDH